MPYACRVQIGPVACSCGWKGSVYRLCARCDGIVPLLTAYFLTLLQCILIPGASRTKCDFQLRIASRTCRPRFRASTARRVVSVVKNTAWKDSMSHEAASRTRDFVVSACCTPAVHMLLPPQALSVLSRPSRSQFSSSDAFASCGCGSIRLRWTRRSSRAREAASGPAMRTTTPSWTAHQMAGSQQRPSPMRSISRCGVWIVGLEVSSAECAELHRRGQDRRSEHWLRRRFLDKYAAGEMTLTGGDCNYTSSYPCLTSRHRRTPQFPRQG